jgi:hypothetical protein
MMCDCSSIYVQLQWAAVMGATGSSPGWNGINSIAMGVYDCTCHGAIFSDPMNTQEVVVGMVGYVDDNNNNVNGTPSEPIQTIVQRSQNSTQLWNDLIHATGGKLNLEKSFFQVLAYDFTKIG